MTEQSDPGNNKAWLMALGCALIVVVLGGASLPGAFLTGMGINVYNASAGMGGDYREMAQGSAQLLGVVGALWSLCGLGLAGSVGLVGGTFSVGAFKGPGGQRLWAPIVASAAAVLGGCAMAFLYGLLVIGPDA